MTSLEYPPTNAPSFKPILSTASRPLTLVTTPRPTTQKEPVKDSENDFVIQPTEIVSAFQGVFNHQKDEQLEVSLMTKVDDKTFTFQPLEDTTISRTNPDTNYGSESSMVVNMIDGDMALISFDLSDLLDAKIDRAVLRLAILDENALNAGIFYVQPTFNGWTENSVTYNSAPTASGTLFATTIDRKDSTHFELDVTNAVGNRVVSFRIIGTNKIGSEFGSKENSERSKVPELVVTIASKEQSFTSLRPVNDSDPSKENPHDLSQLYQGKPSVVQGSGVKPVNLSPGRISGHIWLDKNHDGVKEADEPGLRGVLVDLYSCDDRWVEGIRTSSGGDYIFDDLPEGKYYAVVTANADYVFTPKNVGPDDSKDSDVDSTSGRSDCIDLTSSLQLAVSIDAGMVTSELQSAFTNSDMVETDGTGSENYNCRGKPCRGGEGYCRSEHNYCGTGDTYCNEKSQWTFECPSAAPTRKPTEQPKTGQPSFAHDEDTNCSGEPCTEGDGTWCRSEIGFCGGGKFYCNKDSTWLPKCDGSISSGSSTQTLAEVLESFNSMAENRTIKPTKAPTEMTEFSTFALPTLSHISNPNQVDTTMLGNIYGIETIHYDFQSETPKSDGQNMITINDNEGEGGMQSNHNEAWYSRLVHEPRQNSDSFSRGHLHYLLIQSFILLALI